MKKIIQPVMNLFGGLSIECEKCKAYKSAQHPEIPYDGDFSKQVLVVTEFPTVGDDRSNTVLSGSTGSWLEHKFRSRGWDLFKDCAITFGMKCRPNNKKGVPTVQNLTQCRHKLHAEIKSLQPKAIIVFGSIALGALLGNRITASIHSFSGTQMWFKGIPVYPLFHPQQMIKAPHDKNLQCYFDVTFKKTLHEIENDLPVLWKPDYIGAVQPCLTMADIKDLFENKLKQASEEGLATAFDYEGLGVNPYDKRVIITSLGIAIDGMGSFPFPVDFQEYWKAEERDHLDNYIQDYLCSDVYKIAHNAPFETKYSSQILGVHPEIDWCTMTIQHAIDVRRNTIGLKTQAFIRWEIEDYAADSKKFIKSREDGLNLMDKFPLPKQMLYVGADAFLTLELWKEQQDEIDPKAADFFNESIRTLSYMSANGMKVDLDYYEEQRTWLTSEIDNITETLYESQEVISYQNKIDEEFNLGSEPQLSDFLYNHLGLDAGEKTSVDEESLVAMDHWICTDILKRRKFMKMRDTYISQFFETSSEGYIHPEFTLSRARSLRSSAISPNLQNTPKRDMVAKKIVRAGIVAPEKYRIVEADFKGAEVNTSAAYHRDPVFINYQMDEHADMHRDNSAGVWKCSPENVTKTVRGVIKNSWTFPAFYGSTYISCAPSLWDNRNLTLTDGTTCLDSLKKSGIHTYDKFVAHLKVAEEYMWGTMFKEYTAWKDKVNKDYQENGYIDTFFGFKLVGYLDKKQAANYQIQGTSFHVLLWCLNRARAGIIKRGMKTKLVGQIHDSAIAYVYEGEEFEFLSMLKHICEVEVNEAFDWVVVPYKVDIEYSSLGGNFNEMHELNWAEYVKSRMLK